MLIKFVCIAIFLVGYTPKAHTMTVLFDKDGNARSLHSRDFLNKDVSKLAKAEAQLESACLDSDVSSTPIASDIGSSLSRAILAQTREGDTVTKAEALISISSTESNEYDLLFSELETDCKMLLRVAEVYEKLGNPIDDLIGYGTLVGLWDSTNTDTHEFIQEEPVNSFSIEYLDKCLTWCENHLKSHLSSVRSFASRGSVVTLYLLHERISHDLSESEFAEKLNCIFNLSISCNGTGSGYGWADKYVSDNRVFGTYNATLVELFWPYLSLESLKKAQRAAAQPAEFSYISGPSSSEIADKGLKDAIDRLSCQKAPSAEIIRRPRFKPSGSYCGSVCSKEHCGDACIFGAIEKQKKQRTAEIAASWQGLLAKIDATPSITWNGVSLDQKTPAAGIEHSEDAAKASNAVQFSALAHQDDEVATDKA